MHGRTCLEKSKGSYYQKQCAMCLGVKTLLEDCSFSSIVPAVIIHGLSPGSKIKNFDASAIVKIYGRVYRRTNKVLANYREKRAR